jgi:hypothetical protein
VCLVKNPKNFVLYDFQMLFVVFPAPPLLIPATKVFHVMQESTAIKGIVVRIETAGIPVVADDFCVIRGMICVF